MSGERHWIAVASAEHVRRGRCEGQPFGFMQVCHGKRGPLVRAQPGDGVVYYSPNDEFRGTDKLQSFTAIGRVRPGDPYQVDMGGGFRPYRRDVDWLAARKTPIRPLLPLLAFAAGGRSWGYQFRYGLFEISTDDYETIRGVMTGHGAPVMEGVASANPALT